MEIISTDKAPKAVGPYSQAIKVGGFLFASGQIAINPESGEIVKGGVEAQIEQVLRNISGVLEAAGATKYNVVKTTIFLKDIRHYQTINEIYGNFFGDHKPARSTVEVARLPLDVLVEIEVIAQM